MTTTENTENPENKTCIIPVFSSKKFWYAVYTKSRAEKKVAARIEDEGMEAFVPLQKCIRKWSDRKKIIDKPIISSYVFVNIRKKDIHRVMMVAGAVKFIMFEGEPVTIPEEQIVNLKILADSDADVIVSGEVFLKGDMVEVLYGSLSGLKGELIRVGNKRKVVMRVISSDLNLTVDIQKSVIKKISPKKRTEKKVMNVNTGK